MAEKEEQRKAYKVGLKDAGYDSDDERENAHLMFMNDLNNLRKYFVNSIGNQVKIQEDMQAKFNKERHDLLKQNREGIENMDDLKNIISQLRQEIDDERQFSMRVWAEEQVSLMC